MNQTSQTEHQAFAQRLQEFAAAPFDLPAMASWPATRHCFEPEHILALRAAYAAGRPLLLRGEPGAGKSQFAHAAAHALGRAFLPVVIDSQTQAQDLLWRFDAVARLADAQIASFARPQSGDSEEAQAAADSAADSAERSLAMRHYLQPGPLWYALNWQQAQAQQQDCRHLEANQPDAPPGWTPAQGCLVLLDEIDKAEVDFPNALLEVFANGAFKVPLLGSTIRQGTEQARPLIIVTTNEERELPAAFVRRCLSLTLSLPMEDGALQNWLITRGQWQFPAMKEEVLQECAHMLVQDRRSARDCKPGLAEYLDLLRTIHELGEPALALLPQLKRFYFEKQIEFQGD